MKLSQKEVAALWITEGGSPSKADLASAVVMGESGGDSKAGNYCCHGLYAFNVEVGVTSMKCALNVICATKKAISMSKNGTDWGPWEAYTNGSYRQFLGGSGFSTQHGFGGNKSKSQFASLSPTDILEEAGKIVSPLYRLFKGEAPLPKFPGQGTVEGIVKGGVGSATDILGLGDIASFVEGIGELFLTRDGWVRLGKLIGGVLMFLWGLKIIVRESTGTDPVKAATHAAAQGAAVAATVK